MLFCSIMKRLMSSSRSFGVVQNWWAPSIKFSSRTGSATDSVFWIGAPFLRWFLIMYIIHSRSTWVRLSSPVPTTRRPSSRCWQILRVARSSCPSGRKVDLNSSSLEAHIEVRILSGVRSTFSSCGADMFEESEDFGLPGCRLPLGEICLGPSSEV